MANSKNAAQRLEYNNNTRQLGKGKQMDSNILADDDGPGTLNFWCKMRYWKPREAAALVLGIVPTSLTEEEASSVRFISLETLITRIAPKRRPRPTYVMARLRKLGINVPEELFDTCWTYNKKYNSKSMTNSELKAALELEKKRTCATLEFSNGKDKRSLLAIAYVAIRQAYKSTPSLLDTSVASGLEQSLQTMGFTISSKTVDSWLDAINEFGQDNCNGH